MPRLVVINHLTLDGVMQAPGRRDEDTRDGFEHGGWASSRISEDDVIGAAMAARMASSSALLLGRRTYDDLLSYWNSQESPFKDALNDTPKHVASRTLEEPLPWPNSKLLRGDIPNAVAALKQGLGEELHVLGSGELIQALIRYDLIDEYLLLIHPVILGSGRGLVTDRDARATLRLSTVRPSPSGVLITTYEPVRPT